MSRVQTRPPRANIQDSVPASTPMRSDSERVRSAPETAHAAETVFYGPDYVAPKRATLERKDAAALSGTAAATSTASGTATTSPTFAATAKKGEPPLTIGADGIARRADGRPPEQVERGSVLPVRTAIPA